VSKLRVAIIGCGYMGSRHGSILATRPDVAVAALVDQNVELAEDLKRTAGAVDSRATDDMSAVLADSKIEAVVIATPHDSHPRLAIAAAQAGKHILIEKPLALTVQGCREIEAAVESAGVQLIVGFQTRHAPFVRRACSWVPEPKVVFGQLIAGRWDDDSWAQHADTGGGNVLSQGVHAVDLLAHTAGAAPRVVFAEGGTITHDAGNTNVIDTVLATIRFANGVVGNLVIGDFGPSPWTQLGFYGLFDGTGRSATLHHFSEGLCLGTAGSEVIPFESPTEPARRLSLEDLSPVERSDPYGYAGLISEFVECARENRPPAISATARDGGLATAAVLACFDSIRTGMPVTLED
jgi:myo-inositol 2-dehydrogenase / D-chiro-inositol 1-dehydrogenase